MASGSSPPGRSSGRSRPEAPIFSFAPPTVIRTPEPPTAAAADALAPPRAAVELHARDNGAARDGTPIQEEPVQPVTVALRIACGSCEAENPPGYRFCVTCGAPLTKPIAKTPPAAPVTVEGTPRPVPAPVIAEGAPPRPSPDDPSTRRLDTSSRMTPAAPLLHEAGKPAGGDKIVGAPVVEIEVARHAPARLIECARCHGHCAAGTRFCKYCGAPLETERATPIREAHGRPAEITTMASAPLDRLLDPTARASRADAGGDAAYTSPTVAVPYITPVEPRGGERLAARREVSTLPSSVETAGGAARSSTAPHTPMRSPYSVQAAVPWPDARATRVPEGKLVVIVEDGSEGKTFSLTGRQLDVGRTEGDILLEDDLYVSPRHARLVPQEGGWLLRDLGSVNRIYLRIRKPHILRDADLLLLGLEVLQFQTVSDGERGLGHAIQHGTLLFGSPAIQRRARLCQKTVEGVTRDVYHLYRDETVIGRETGDIVFTSDPFLSRRHAVIRRNSATGEYAVTDLDSSNGTYVAIREDVSLVNGDYVRIGQHLFRVDLS